MSACERLQPRPHGPYCCDPVTGSEAAPQTTLLLGISPGVGGLPAGAEPGAVSDPGFRWDTGPGRREGCRKDSGAIKETRPQSVKDRAP